MKKISLSSEEEMVYEFLKMEIESDRYADRIEAIIKELHISRHIITDGDIKSEQENVERAKVLGRFRGYRNKEIFENFPAKINWVWTDFAKEDMVKIKYIEYSYWNELSYYTGSPVEAAKTILSGRTVYDVPNDGFFEAYKYIKEGYIFPPMIMLTDADESRYILLEGHKRMTAYAIEPDLFQNVSVLLGYCEQDALNRWYGEMPERM